MYLFKTEIIQTLKQKIRFIIDILLTPSLKQKITFNINILLAILPRNIKLNKKTNNIVCFFYLAFTVMFKYISLFFN